MQVSITNILTNIFSFPKAYTSATGYTIPLFAIHDDPTDCSNTTRAGMHMYLIFSLSYHNRVCLNPILEPGTAFWF